MLVAHWLAAAAGPADWPVIEAVVRENDESKAARDLAYRLALSYERHGERTKAVSVYLRLMPDARAGKRLRAR